MAYIALSKIKKDVRVIVDEDENITSLTEIEADSDTLQTDAITEAMVLKAIDKVHEMAPIGYVSGAAYQYDDAEWYGNEYSIETHIPDNTLRVVMVKASSWTNAVYAMVEAGSSIYMQQSSRFAGIRATKRMPVVALVPDAHNGGNKIECYPMQEVDDDHTSDVDVLLIEKAAVNAENKLLIADRCYDAVLYMTASLYYQTLGEQQKANAMAMEAGEMMGMKAQSA